MSIYWLELNPCGLEMKLEWLIKNFEMLILVNCSEMHKQEKYDRRRIENDFCEWVILNKSSFTFHSFGLGWHFCLATILYIYYGLEWHICPIDALARFTLYASLRHFQFDLYCLGVEYDGLNVKVTFFTTLIIILSYWNMMGWRWKCLIDIIVVIDISW